MDRLNYREVNIELTKNLIEEKKDKENKGTLERHKKIVDIISKYTDKSNSLLEVGCREGDLFLLLKESGFKNLYGIDISPLGIEILHKRGFKGSIVDVQEGIDLDKKFHTVIASHCIEHIPDVNKVIQNIYDILEENGIFYIEVPKQPKEPIPTKWGHYYCFESIENLKEFFQKDKWKLLYEYQKINKNPKRGNLKCVYKKI